MRAGLSKSRITLFEQCAKRLWLSVHRPEQGEHGAGVSAAMSTGHAVGEIACSLYPEGRMISADAGLRAAVAETTALLASGWAHPIFEASFAHDGVLVRVDLLLPEDGGWHVAEVKSTTGVKAYHLGDVATQLWVMRSSGVDVRRASIRHIDRGFVLLRPGDYDGLFTDSHVEGLVEPLIAARPALVAGAREVLAAAEPEREMGAHCDDPFPCSFKTWCGRDLPPAPLWPVTLLPDATGKKVARHWLEQGVVDLAAIPAGSMPNPKLARVHEATRSGVAYHDRDAIRAETAEWPYPHIFLDFETIQFAIPRWLGTAPYQQIAFQFSAHVVDEGGAVSHREFLSLDGSDPRRACAEALIACIPAEGAIISWNAAFERTCLRALADQFSDLAEELRELAARVVDLLPVVRRHYYHPDQRGSWSIKAVLPTIAPELAYEGLVEVKSGTDAQAGYLEAIATDTSPGRRTAIRAALLDYCRRDTEAMLVVMARLTA